MSTLRNTDLSFFARSVAAVAGVAAASWPALASNPRSYNLAAPTDALFDKLESGAERAVMLVVGDSVSFREDSYLGYLQERFWGEFGVGDCGYRGASNAFGSPQSFHDTRPLGGSWRENAGDIPSRARISGPREVDAFFRPTDIGPLIPDGIYTQLEDGAEFFINGFGPTANLYLYCLPGAGEAQIELNGELLETVIETDAAEPALLVHEVDTGALPGEPYSLSVFATPATGPVVFAGAEMRSGTPGLTIQRITRGGSGPDANLKSINPTATAHLQTLAPDLIWIMLDPDQRFGELYMQDMTALLDHYADVFPGVPTVLVSHHPFIPDIELQSDQLLQLARERGMGYIDLNETWADYDAMNDAGLMNGVVHLSPEGGQWFGAYLYGALLDARACPADWDASGTLDVADVIALLGSFDAGEPAADLDGNSALDVFDVIEYLGRFSEGCD